VSTADVEDTRRTDLGLLQQLNGQYGAEQSRCNKTPVLKSLPRLDLIAGRR